VRLAPKVAVVLAAACSVFGTQAGNAPAEVTSNEWVSFTTFPFNSCNGELVIVRDGRAHVVQRVQPDGSRFVSTNGHFTSVGTLGNEYQLNWQEDFVLAPGESTYTSQQMIVSQGSAPNQLVTFVIDLATGTLTVTQRCFGEGEGPSE
jgi:hypothetical protein